MRKASRSKSIAQLCVAAAMSLAAFSLQAQLMLAHEGHHAGHGGCQVKGGDFPVTVSIYEVPEGNIPPMHSYCDNVPNIGKVNITIELPNDAREIPLAVRLVKEQHGGHGAHGAHGAHKGESASAPADSGAKPHEQGHEMNHDEHHGHGGHDAHAEHAGHMDASQAAVEHDGFYMPPTAHLSGIIVVAADITELGEYSVLLEKVEGDTVRTAVRVPVHVGKGGGHAGHGSGFGMMEIMLLLGVAGGAAFYFLRRKAPGKEAAEKS